VLDRLRVTEGFEPEWVPHHQVSRWTILELVARGLLHAAGRDNDADGIWSVLAAIDGRPPRTLPVPWLRSPLATWMAPVLESLRLQIGEALQADDATFETIAETLIVLPGELFFTNVHVDLVASLDDVRVPVRRAGLDLDPGWLPDWGRIVTFHYEAMPGGLR
jgi:hypothetical protein